MKGDIIRGLINNWSIRNINISVFPKLILICISVFFTFNYIIGVFYDKAPYSYHFNREYAIEDDDILGNRFHQFLTEFSVLEKIKLEDNKEKTPSENKEKLLCIGVTANENTNKYSHVTIGSILRGMDKKNKEDSEIYITEESVSVKRDINYTLFVNVLPSVHDDTLRYLSLLESCEKSGAEYTLIVSGKLKASNLLMKYLRKYLEEIKKMPEKFSNMAFVKLFYPTANFGWNINDIVFLFTFNSVFAITFALVYAHKIDERVKKSNWILLLLFSIAFFSTNNYISSVGKQNTFSIYSNFGLHQIYAGGNKNEKAPLYGFGGVAGAHLYETKGLVRLVDYIKNNKNQKANVDDLIDSWAFEKELNIFHLSPHLFQLVFTEQEMLLPADYFSLSREFISYNSSLYNTFMSNFFLDDL